MISIIFHLDGSPHEVIIKDTKYYVKELYSYDKKFNNGIITVRKLLPILLVLGPLCGSQNRRFRKAYYPEVM